MNNTPINQINDFELTTKLQDFVKQAYYRRDRQVPANIADIVATLKADLLRAMPTVGILTIDQAVFDAANDPKTPLSPALFFSAIRNKFVPPYQSRGMDADEYTRPDTEEDTLNLLDTMADQIAAGRKAFFNWRREFDYLVMRGQLSENAWEARMTAVKARIQSERVRDFMRPIAEWTGQHLADAEAMAKAAAVCDWLKACNTQGITPSQALAQYKDEQSYHLFRQSH